MLSLRHVTVNFTDGRTLIVPFSLDIEVGETVTLMGASGAGKSTLLSYIGGDLAPAFRASGEILLHGQSLVGIAAENRKIARLFQDDFLFPHMTVGENLLFAIPRMPQADRLAKMRDALQLAELDGFEDRPPHTLSGGQRSRVALMRALLSEPSAILLDEPFSKLDEELRQQMRSTTYSLIGARKIPVLLVTHDRDDAPPGGRVFKLSTAGEIIRV
jgi:putative thiamine transport system ATP-binding protein